MKYLEMVQDDVRNWMEENKDWVEEYAEDRDDLEEAMNDALWVEDSVTGNASGSYTCNSYESREYVLDDIETVKDALLEFGCTADEIGNRFLNEDWEWLDVTARCYILGQAISSVLDEFYSDRWW